MRELIAQAEALEHSANCKYPDGAADCPKCNAELRAQAEQPAEPVARVEDMDEDGFPQLVWYETGTLQLDSKLYLHPDPRIAALEGLLREALEHMAARNEDTGLDVIRQRIAAALKGR